MLLLPLVRLISLRYRVFDIARWAPSSPLTLSVSQFKRSPAGAISARMLAMMMRRCAGARRTPRCGLANTAPRRKMAEEVRMLGRRCERHARWPNFGCRCRNAAIYSLFFARAKKLWGCLRAFNARARLICASAGLYTFMRYVYFTPLPLD